MGQQTATFFIVGACGIALFIGVLRKNMEWLLNIVMRSVLGTVAMYFINSGLAMVGISLGVGINLITVLTSGILGFPGLVALYGLCAYKLL